jgi:dihydroorotase-like cyclic amidohydrolase
MLVRNGQVITEDGVLDDADVLIEDGVITAVGRGLPEVGEVVDAAGYYVLPGVIDPHVHTTQAGVSLNEPMLDDLEEASRAALFGGATTICAYAQRIPGADVLEMADRQIDFGKRAAYGDFAVNALCFGGDEVVKVIDDGRKKLGVRTFKAILAYHQRGMMIDDDELLRMMRAAAAVDATVLVHAENGRVNDCLEHLVRDRGEFDDGHLLETAPAELEAEGIFKTAMLARITGARVLFVHLTSRLGCEALAFAKSQSGAARLSVETQPHYGLLTNQAVIERGALAKVGPVLKEDTDRDAVREAMASGLVSHLSSDHSPRNSDVKLAADNILDAPYGGISGTELVLPLAWKLGMQDGLFDIVRLAQMVSTNAAKQYGLYPKKGAIRVGADGDLALVPVEQPAKVITPANLHMKSDYSLYEGIPSAGFPTFVINRGEVVVAEGELLTRPQGRYIHS